VKDTRTNARFSGKAYGNSPGERERLYIDSGEVTRNRELGERQTAARRGAV
jgi:hypothetical protein